jgi:hypothetical protein
MGSVLRETDRMNVYRYKSHDDMQRVRGRQKRLSISAADYE